jgi:hypothetical protein
MTDTFSPDNPVLQELGITGTLASTGAVQYDVSDLRDNRFIGMEGGADKHIKLHLYSTAHASTLQQHTRESKFSKPGDATSKKYVRWVKNWSYTASFKPRKDGTCSFNLYRHTTGKGLANFTSRAEVLFYGLGTPEMQKLFITEVRRLHTANIGPWRLPEANSELKGNSRFDAGSHYSNEIIYNVYPGFFQTSRSFSDSRRIFYSVTTDIFLPFFRQPSPRAMIEKFAGKNLDPVFYEKAEHGFTSLELPILFLFGKLIPQSDLKQVFKLTNRSQFGMGHLTMIRSLLLKVNARERLSLFNDLVASLDQSAGKRSSSSNEDYISSLNILLDDVATKTTFAKPYTFADVKELKDVGTWPALVKALRTHANNTFQIKREDNAQKLSNVITAFRNRFEVLNAPSNSKLAADASKHFCEFVETAGGIYFVYTKYGSRIALLTTDGSKTRQRSTKKEIDHGARIQVESTMLFPRNGLLPTQHPFTKTARKLNDYNLSTDRESHWLLSFEDAVKFVDDLADTLERILLRHGLPQTKLNLSRLLGFYFGYYLQQPRHGSNGRPIKAKPVPKSLYTFLAPSELTASEILFALEQELTLEQAVDLHGMPDSWVNDLFS